MNSRRHAFTLIELLVSLTIVVVLTVLGFAGFRSVRHQAMAATEVNAARNLMVAYLGHAADNAGRVLPGYRTDDSATNLDGDLLHHPINARYPWRLTPHAPSVKGILLFNGNESLVDEPNRDYLVSVRPNLGINAVFIGGHFGSGSPLRPSDRLVEAVGKYYISRISESSSPSGQIVFASARNGSGSEGVGHFEVRAPSTLSPEWSPEAFDEDAAASDHGFVDFRWSGGKAVAAMLGGNVEMLDEEQMRDMRRWSDQAARLDDPDFTVGRR